MLDRHFLRVSCKTDKMLGKFCRSQVKNVRLKMATK